MVDQHNSSTSDNGANNDNGELVDMDDITANLTEDLEAAIEGGNPQLADLEQKITELKDLYVRAQAELQNVQRRSNDELKKARDFAIAGFAKEVVIIRDYLEMALKDESGNFEALKMGVDLTLKQLIQVFEHNLIKEVMPKEKDKLDPNLHQAMQAVEAPDFEPNTIVSVVQKGYMLRDRVLRPATVTVAK